MKLKNDIELTSKKIADNTDYTKASPVVEQITKLKFYGVLDGIKELKATLLLEVPTENLQQLLDDLDIANTKTKIEVGLGPSLQQTLEKFGFDAEPKPESKKKKGEIDWELPKDESTDKDDEDESKDDEDTEAPL